MKKILFSAFLIVSTIGYSQVGINTTTPSSAAVLHLVSLNAATGVYGGFMPPVVNLGQRALIPVTAVDDGLMIYLVDGTTRCVQMYNATSTNWVNMYCMPVAASAMYQDFELVPNTPELTYSASGGTFSTGTGPFPSGAPRFSDGSQGYQVSNSTVNVDFASVDTSTNTTVNLSFDLAAFSGTSGNGMDGTDVMTVFVSTDGVTWSSEVTVNGAGNSYWGFAGSAVASGVYDGNNVPTAYTAPGGGLLSGPNAYSKVTLTGLPISPTLFIRIELKNNSSNEIWVIDNVVLNLL